MPSENVGILETAGFEEVAAGVGLGACVMLVAGAIDGLADGEMVVWRGDVVGVSFDFG